MGYNLVKGLCCGAIVCVCVFVTITHRSALSNWVNLHSDSCTNCWHNCCAACTACTVVEMRLFVTLYSSLTIFTLSTPQSSYTQRHTHAFWARPLISDFPFSLTRILTLSCSWHLHLVHIYLFILCNYCTRWNTHPHISTRVRKENSKPDV